MTVTEGGLGPPALSRSWRRIASATLLLTMLVGTGAMLLRTWGADGEPSLKRASTNESRQTAPLTQAQAAEVVRSLRRSPSWAPSPGDNRAGASDVSILHVLPTAALLHEGAELLVAGQGVLGEPRERLCFRSAREFLIVDGPARLSGRVRLGTGEDAVQFVRLFTSPVLTDCYGQPWWMEVVPCSGVTESFVFGRESRLVAHAARMRDLWPSGLCGILCQEDWDHSGLEPARVDQTEDGFVVTRPLFRASAYWDPSPRTGSLVHIARERVSRKGGYHREFVGEVALSHVELTMLPKR